jgi:hypothetical protein
MRAPLPQIALALAGAAAGAAAIGLGVAVLTTEPPAAIAPATAPPSTFVAFARDFASFRAWERHPIEGAMLPIGTAPGPAFVYASRRPARGEHRWPIGSMLVKTIENGDPSGWTIHAMAKRGVPFNGAGAAGWEFFELRWGEDGELAIVWRGLGPPSGHGYAAMGRDAGSEAIPLVCNDCHAAAWQSDGVLTPALRLDW